MAKDIGNIITRYRIRNLVTGSFHFNRVSKEKLKSEESYLILLTYLLTYLHHGAESFLKNQPLFKLVKKFPAFYGTRRFITAFIIPRYLSLS